MLLETRLNKHFRNGASTLIIRWTELTLEDFEQAMLYIQEDNPDATVNVAQRIWDAGNQLAVYPGMGKSGRVSGTREFVISGTSFILPYRVVQDRVEILRVLHSSQKWPIKL